MSQSTVRAERRAIRRAVGEQGFQAVNRPAADLYTHAMPAIDRLDERIKALEYEQWQRAKLTTVWSRLRWVLRG